MQNQGGNHLDAKSLAAALSRPLILGASLSADWATASPGKRLALKYTNLKSIHTHAFGGRTGKSVISSLAPGALEDRTCVIAIDLLFWDSAQKSIHPTVQAFERLMLDVIRLQLPIVVGEVPTLMPALQPHAERLNAMLTRYQTSYSGFFVMPFVQLYAVLLRDGELQIKGRTHNAAELASDGLHIGDVASEHLAEVMENVLRGERVSFEPEAMRGRAP